MLGAGTRSVAFRLAAVEPALLCRAVLCEAAKKKATAEASLAS